MKNRSHADPSVRKALDKQNPEIKRRVLDEAGRAPSRSSPHGPQLRIGTESNVIQKPVRRIGPSRASKS
jgi:hypothetical protein